jgi:hypothetical protein
MISSEGDACICSRVNIGAKKQCGSAGWLHILDGSFKPVKVKEKNSMPINWNKLNKYYMDNLRKGQGLYGTHFEDAMADWGVSERVMDLLQLGYDGDAYTLPMRNARLEIIGIQRRFTNGGKRMVKGSKNGLFVPTPFGQTKWPVLICEGASDTATALELGQLAVGRPNCNSCLVMVRGMSTRGYITIVADNDIPGLKGADRLFKSTLKLAFSVTMVIPPTGIKDLRDWKKNGLTAEEFDSYIRFGHG